MYYILYNPLADNGNCLQNIEELKKILEGKELVVDDITRVKDFAEYFGKVTDDDTVVIAGGDGTLNRFVNLIGDAALPKNLYYYGAGTGNDFRQDVAPDEKGLIELTPYIENLPTVTVKGKTYRFINGIGYGIDGYCCEVGDKQREKDSSKKINYTSIAIKGLLFFYHRVRAKITVDGVTKEFRHVWLAPTMNGRFYGGGMMVTPEQNRLDPEKFVSTAVMYSPFKLKTLMVFPSIFKGEHVKHTEMVQTFKGHEVKVEFDRPTALQIDGETILAVTEYTVKAGMRHDAPAAKEEAAAV